MSYKQEITFTLQSEPYTAQSSSSKSQTFLVFKTGAFRQIYRLKVRKDFHRPDQDADATSTLTSSSTSSQESQYDTRILFNTHGNLASSVGGYKRVLLARGEETG